MEIHGVALQDLARRSRRDLEDEFGSDVLRQARQALPQTWDDLLEDGQQQQQDNDGELAPPVSRDVAKQIFLAAIKQQLPQLALSVFEYMDATFPTQVDFVVYGEVFTLLSRAGKTDETLAVFERNKPLYSDERPAPELIYRFGVFGKLGKKDFDGVTELIDEMASYGIELSNELKSRIMIAYAKNSDSDKVLEIYESLDPQVGRWHEADVDRVINSMGLIHYPDEAFEFYRNAQIKLTGNTILALLNVCRANDRPKHAMAILANRKRFNLVLSTREYNKVLETLEQFDEHAEIAAILDEMAQNGVRLDKLTKTIVARNQHFLQGTAHEGNDADGSDTSHQHQRFAGDEDHENWDLKLSEQDTRRKMQELNASKAFAMAAGLADMHATPLHTAQDGEAENENDSATETMLISPSLASEAVAAYANSGAHEKVRALLAGFASVKGDFGHALTFLISFYSKQGDHEMVYRAFKASQFQGRDIYRVKEALDRFHEFGDADAAMTLFHQASQQIAVVLEESGNDFRGLKKALSFDRANLVKMTLQVLIGHQKLDDVVHVLDTLETQGFHVRTSDYTTVFRLMREQQAKNGNGGVLYKATDFDRLWDDMTRRGVAPSKAILAHCCVALASGDAPQQQKLLDAYAQVKQVQDDSYNIPPVCYSALLQATAALGSRHDVQSLFDEAVRSLQEARKSNPKIRFFPRDWVSTLVAKLAASDSDVDADAVFQQVKKMKKRCGGYAYDALLTALRVCCLATNKSNEVAQLRTLFVDAKFRLTLGDAEGLLHVATENNSASLAVLAIQLYEQGNVVQAKSKVEAEAPETETRASETESQSAEEAQNQEPKTAGENVVTPFQLQKKPSAPVLKKIRAMYDAALTLSEQVSSSSEGEDKDSETVIAFLRERKREIALLK